MPYFDEPVRPCERNLGEMRDRSMLRGTALAPEIQLTDGSTAVEQGKLIFVVSTEPSLQQLISPFTTGKNRLSIVHVNCSMFTLRFLSRKSRKEIRGSVSKLFRCCCRYVVWMTLCCTLPWHPWLYLTSTCQLLRAIEQLVPNYSVVSFIP